MNIAKKMAAKESANMKNEGVTIAFLGDSVTQGCFELYKKADGSIETVYDKRASYEMGVFDMLCTLYPTCTINIINAGISGDTARGGLLRLERDVLRHEPDLCVVCYGLNDCSESEHGIEKYVSSLCQIFEKLRDSNVEVIFMTPNMMNTEISPHITEPSFIELAKQTAKKQNSGLFDKYIEAAVSLCRELDVTVCDCYAIWKTLFASGVNTTELLSNKINHPLREMNRIFSYELVRTMLNG